MSDTDTPTLVSISEAARVLKRSTKTVERMTAAGLLRVAAVTPGGQRRYLLTDVETLAAERAS